MIPATHWADSDDGSAWVVFGDDDNERQFFPAEWASDLDRPCDACINKPSPSWAFYPPGGGGGGGYFCTDCDGTGRHTFDVEVERLTGPEGADIARLNQATNVVTYAKTHRVSVVPGMVLPIVAWDDQRAIASGDHFIVTGSPTDPTWAKRYERGEVGRAMHDITLPPAAKPGLWAIQLRKAGR